MLGKGVEQLSAGLRGCWEFLGLEFSLALKVVDIEIPALVPQTSTSSDKCSREIEPGKSPCVLCLDRLGKYDQMSVRKS